MWLIIATLVTAGIFGGVVNYLLAKPEDVPPRSLIRSIVVGLAASFLVPLFLNMISSNLLEQIKSGDTSRLLILSGFSLVAAISSTAFIRTLSDRVLREAKEAKKEAQEARIEVTKVHKELQPFVAKETETDEPGEARSAAPLTSEQRLLKALTGGRWVLRSQRGLAKETEIDPVEVAQLLEQLTSQGMVGRRTSANGPRWFITETGRARLGE